MISLDLPFSHGIFILGICITLDNSALCHISKSIESRTRLLLSFSSLNHGLFEQEQEQERSPDYISPTPIQFIYIIIW